MTIKGSVLIVDDDSAMREMLASQLEEEGISFAVAAGVEEALAAIHGTLFCAVVSDVHMSPRDGFALLESSRDGPPVIMMSSFASESDAHQAISRGAAAFLRKPFDPADLLRLLEELSR